MANSGGISFSTLFEVAGVVLNSTKTKQPDKDGKAGLAVDPQKLALGMAGIAGQQVLKGFAQRQARKRLRKELAAGLISAEDFKAGRSAADIRRKNKKGFLRPGLLLGALVGGALYLLSLSPEDREKLFKQVEQGLAQIVGILNEIQGKPYSDDFEDKKA
ncbi:MAG: hypothetical protein JWP00_2250 [Chloroflexi bacterium]|jgi:hypothetical protein|nr:hypothetical protein [Chloroflexota bacterium]